MSEIMILNTKASIILINAKYEEDLLANCERLGQRSILL